MIARTSLAIAALLALASCSLFKKKDNYDTGNSTAGNPYGVPGSGYDTSGSEAGAYTPEGGTPPANPTYAPAAYEETTPTTPATPAAHAASGGGGGAAKVHTVGKGDTLWGLAKKYNVSVDSIKAANNLTKDTCVLGSKLKIPAR